MPSPARTAVGRPPGPAIAAVTAVIAFTSGWLVYTHAVRHSGDRPYPWRDLTSQLGPIEFPRPSGRLFRSRESLVTYFRLAVPGEAAPPIDFDRREALLVAAGPRSSTGYDVRILGVTEERGRLLVEVREQAPGLGDRVRAVVTYPYRLVTFPATDKPVFIDWKGRP